MFTMRFDMRMAQGTGPAADFYAAALDMCAWAETRGAALVVLSEHHGAEDSHLPVPLILASALAARTSTLQILCAAVAIPLWDPVRLAEEIAVLDVISRGRVSFAFGIGHRPEEYDHFGIEFDRRGALADEYLPLVRRLVRGDVVDRDGISVTVTPACVTAGGPTMLVAGGSRAAARRAGRNGLGFISQSADPALRECYEQACRDVGQHPGMVQFPVEGSPTAVFVCDDVEAAWAELGPFLLHDAAMAASYRHGDDSVASITRAQSVDELRRSGGPYAILTGEQAAEQMRSGQLLPLHPLCGGIPPAMAWPYLSAAVECAR